MKLPRSVTITVVLLCAAIAGCGQVEKSRIVSENLVGQPGNRAFVWISPDARRFAYVIFPGDKRRAVIDGVKSREYDHVVSYIFFSPDSKHVAYGAMSGDASFVVLDGKEGKRYDEVCFGFREGIYFSPDSSRMAYIAARRIKEPEGEPSDPDYDDTACYKSFVVIDGREEKEYDRITGLTFSKNGKRFGYTAKVGLKENQLKMSLPEEWDYEKEFVVVDGVEYKKYDEIRGLVFSADGKHFACAARTEPLDEDAHRAEYDWCIVLDGNESSKYCEVGNPVFSPDGRHFAYGVETDSKAFVVLDGKEQKKGYGSISPRLYPDVVFSHDSKRHAYAAYHDRGQVLILDGKVTTCHCDPMHFIFSPDNKRYAYTAYKGGAYVLVLDGKELPAGGSPVFSPDSKRFACSRGWHGHEYIVLDGKKQKEYSSVSETFLFSPDSKHIVYWAEEKDKQFVVVDENEGKKYDKVHEPIVFDSDNEFHYLAVKGDKLYLVEEKLK